MNNKTQILILMAGIFLLWAYCYTKAEPEYVWVTEDKYDHISSILFTADSNYIVVNGLMLDGKTTRYTILDVDNGDIAKEVIGEGHIFAFTKDGKYAYSYKGRTFYKLSASTLTPYDSLDLTKIIGDFWDCELSADEQKIFLSGVILDDTRKLLAIIDVATFDISEITQITDGACFEIAVSPKNDYIAVRNTYTYASPDPLWPRETKVELYNAHTLEHVKSFKLEKDSKLRRMQFSNDGRYFAVVEYKVISIYDIHNQFALVHQIKVEDSETVEAFYAFTFSNDSQSFYESNSKYMTTTYLRKWGISQQKPDCIYDLRLNEINEYPIIFNSDKSKFIAKPKQLPIRSHLIMVKNPCYEGTNVTETGENKEIKTVSVIDNRISIPIDNHVITNQINWQIHDIMGNQVLSGIEHSVTNELQIDVSILPSGTYFLSIQFEKETVNYKFIRVK